MALCFYFDFPTYILYELLHLFPFQIKTSTRLQIFSRREAKAVTQPCVSVTAVIKDSAHAPSIKISIIVTDSIFPRYRNKN